MKHTPGTLSADYKVPGGKLLRVRLTVDQEQSPPTIHSLLITGDFFMHPEEAIEALEAQLAGASLTAEALRPRIAAFFEGDVEVIGASVEDIVQVILAAARPLTTED